MRDTIIPIVAQRRAHDGGHHHDHDEIAAAPPKIALTRREFPRASPEAVRVWMARDQGKHERRSCECPEVADGGESGGYGGIGRRVWSGSCGGCGRC